MCNEKEKNSGDNPSDVNPSQGGNMNAVHTPKIEENQKAQQEYGDEFDSMISPLEDITGLIEILMPIDCNWEIEPILKKKRLEKIKIRARNARDALSFHIEFLGKLFWQRSYGSNCTDPVTPNESNEFGQLIQGLGGMLRTCITLEENCRCRLNELNIKEV